LSEPNEATAEPVADVATTPDTTAKTKDSAETPFWKRWLRKS
jgi:hypothetical protein